VLALATNSNPACLYDTYSGKLMVSLPAVVRSVCFSPDGRALATVGSRTSGEGVRLWHVGTGKELLNFQVPNDWLKAPKQETAVTANYRTIAFSPDGRWLAVSEQCCGRSGWVSTQFFVCEVATGQLVREIDQAASEGRVIVFTPDGWTLIASGSFWRDRGATLWDLASAERVGQVNGYAGYVTCVALAPDGHTFLTGGSDGTVLLWDARALPKTKPAPRQLSASDLAALWEALGCSDARKAYQAIVALSAGGKASVAFLQEHLKPAMFPALNQLEQLVLDLDDHRYAVRARAMTALSQQGELGAIMLRKALKEGISLEKRRRIEMLLAKLEQFTPPLAELRQLRALAALERMGDAQARKLIEALAAGVPEARLTQQATAALVRLKKTKA
jgi:WD40 repeat protein